MQPEDLPGADPNTLPYFITETQTSYRVPVRFEPLTPADSAELNNEDWANAVFASAWKQYVHAENVCKLVRVGSQDQRIQGVVRMGRTEADIRYLKKSLLEAAPFNQQGSEAQIYRGVGRVLIARLVAESILQGKEGRVLVLPRPGTQGFYQSLGFEPVEPLKRKYILNVPAASVLLNSACNPRRQSLRGVTFDENDRQR